jgi:DNA/RNA endonuclease YhcR with UshA esterase domain
MKKFLGVAAFFIIINLPAHAQKKYSYDQAKDHIGELAIVSGPVINVYTASSGTVFLDFGAQYPDNPFTAVIFDSSASKFKNLDSLQNQNVEVKGKIKDYKGKPEIVLTEPDQIKIVPASKAKKD